MTNPIKQIMNAFGHLEKMVLDLDGDQKKFFAPDRTGHKLKKDGNTYNEVGTILTMAGIQHVFKQKYSCNTLILTQNEFNREFAEGYSI